MVRIVTDSSSDIPAEIARELKICVVPMYVRFGTEVYRDGVDLETEEFYQKLVTSRTVPTTSAPKMKDFAEAYERLSEETDEIVSIHLSSTFSSAYEIALRASGRVKKDCRIEVIDSKTAAMGLGLLVIAAAKQAQKGQKMQQIVKMVKEAAPRARVYVCFETLEYLRRGGRIGKAESLLGSPIKVHPIVGLEGGEIKPVGRERSRNRALDRLCSLAADAPNVSSVAIEQGAAAGEADRLHSRLAALLPGKDIYSSAVGSAVAVHTGPRVVGVCLL
ncbi:MAG: DegV family protein [Dehalococcoidia bacterium]|nr:DegV family protein [Dehalococcoidia bacterium]